MPEARDDGSMGRFESGGVRRFTARDAVVAVLVCLVLLLLFAGGSVRRAGAEMTPGVAKTIVTTVGKPAGWVSDQLPFADVRGHLTSWLSPDDDLGGGGSGFVSVSSGGTGGAGGGSPGGPGALDPAGGGG